MEPHLKSRMAIISLLSVGSLLLGNDSV